MDYASLRELRWLFLNSYACWIPPAEWRGTVFARRRQFFESHRYTHGDGAAVCAACGFPTLTQSIEYDYCAACDWEDDCSDDPNADEVSRGNGGVTLNQARKNVLENGTMFCHADARWMHPSSYDRVLGEKACAHRKALFELLDGLMELNDPEAISCHWERINTHWREA